MKLSLLTVCLAATAPWAETMKPLVDLNLNRSLQNAGTLGGVGELKEYAPGEGPAFCRGVSKWGVSFAASSRGGGSLMTQAGGGVEVPAPGLDGVTQLTLALWFQPLGENSVARLLFFSPGWDLFVSGRQVTFKTKHAGVDTGFSVQGDAKAVVEGAWNFLAVTYDVAAGTATCYHGGPDQPARVVAEWTGVPLPDMGGMVLTVGNLGGIRPFRGLVDEVRVYDQLLTADAVEALRSSTVQARPSLRDYAAHAVPRSLFSHADACFSTRFKRPEAPEAWKSFDTNRLVWVYTNDADYIANAKAAGIESFQSAINSIMRVDDEAAYCRNLEGERVVAPWMVAFDKKNPVYWGCNNQPAYLDKCVESACKALDAGADWIQFDDWSMIVSAYGWGGACFCDRCLAGFREYLQQNLSAEQTKELGIDDLAAFDYKAHLAAKHQLTTDKDYRAQRGKLPLEAHFQQFQRQSVREFFQELRKRLEAHAGRRVPLSVNSTLMHPEQRNNFCADIVDFLLGETWQPDFTKTVICTKVADALGKWQVFSPIPRDLQDTRRATAAAYALGHLPLVPWDIYMGSDATGIQPRYFGKPEEYGDLYRFVKDNAELLNGYETPASVGVVVNTDKYDAGAIAAVCSRLLENHVPFAFALAGHSSYDSSLTAEQLKGFDTVIRVNPPDDFTPADRAALEAAAEEAIVLSPRELTPASLEPLSLLRYWGPNDLVFLPRMQTDGTTNRLLLHVLNLNQNPTDKSPVPVKWTSLLLRLPAMLGPDLTAARWHAPGAETATLEVEKLNEGLRVILPKIELWGIVELEFGR